MSPTLAAQEQTGDTPPLTPVMTTQLDAESSTNVEQTGEYSPSVYSSATDEPKNAEDDDIADNASSTSTSSSDSSAVNVTALSQEILAAMVAAGSRHYPWIMRFAVVYHGPGIIVQIDARYGDDPSSEIAVRRVDDEYRPFTATYSLVECVRPAATNVARVHLETTFGTQIMVNEAGLPGHANRFYVGGLEMSSVYPPSDYETENDEPLESP